MRKVLFVLGMMMMGFYTKAQWSELGGTNTSTFNNHIHTMSVDSIGNVYVAGAFTNSLGDNYVAKWNGVNWKEVKGLNKFIFNGYIYNSCFDKLGNLYVSGTFTDSLGKYIIARWDGSKWTQVPDSNNFFRYEWFVGMAADLNGNLYASSTAWNANQKYYVGKWDGNKWVELGGTNSSFFNGGIIAMDIDNNNNLYVAGNFTDSTGQNYVAKWDGISWHRLLFTNLNYPIPTIPAILSITHDFNSNIYCCVNNNNPYGKRYIAKWDGNQWNDISGNNSLFFTSTPNVITSDSLNNIYVGGTQTKSAKKIITKWDGSNWDVLGDTSISTINNLPYTVSANKYPYLYFAGSFTNSSGKHYVAKYTPQPLPLKLLSFNAKKQTPNSVALNWQTANEVNVSYIKIQRSVNGKDFENIGKVNASCCSYEFQDGQLSTVNGQLYYRLEMVDKDGSKTYSQIQQINIQHQTSNIAIFPNPAKDLVTIECSGAKELLIIDNLGRIVYRSTFNSQSLTINTKQFAKGVYVVNAMMNNGHIKTEKLVVE